MRSGEDTFNGGDDDRTANYLAKQSKAIAKNKSIKDVRGFTTVTHVIYDTR